MERKDDIPSRKENENSSSNVQCSDVGQDCLEEEEEEEEEEEGGGRGKDNTSLYCQLTQSAYNKLAYNMHVTCIPHARHMHITCISHACHMHITCTHTLHNAAVPQ